MDRVLVLHIAHIFNFGQIHVYGVNWRSGVILEARFWAQVTALAIQITFKVVRDVIEVCDSPEAAIGIIGQADVEEAGILLSNERVHIPTRWSDEQQVVLIENLSLALLGADDLLCFEQFFVLIV